MSLPISDRIVGSALLCLAIAGCDSSPTTPTNGVTAGDGAAVAAPVDDGKVDCAIGQGADWAHVCPVERGEGAEKDMLTLRHPDGGFRRFRIVQDGHGLVSADGSETTRVKLVDSDRIELTIGNDHYRLPAVARSSQP